MKKDPEIKTAPEQEPETESPPAAEQEQNTACTSCERLSGELAEAVERFLRVSAEYDNYKKRTVREKEELYSVAASDVLTKLFGVFDNLERAGTCTDFESLKKGVDMILDSFHASLAACGVEEISALGEPFDPTVHCAVLQEESAEYEENTVCDVLQKGYRLGERVLRCAVVKVAK